MEVFPPLSRVVSLIELSELSEDENRKLEQDQRKECRAISWACLRFRIKDDGSVYWLERAGKTNYSLTECTTGYCRGAAP